MNSFKELGFVPQVGLQRGLRSTFHASAALQDNGVWEGSWSEAEQEAGGLWDEVDLLAYWSFGA